MSNTERAIIIIDNRESLYGLFDSLTMKDSEALHKMLCQYDPGEEYRVMFTKPESVNPLAAVERIDI